MRCETDFMHGSDEPLRRIVLIPSDGIAVVHWELMVEVMVTLTDGDERSDEVVTRGMFIIERSITEPVGK